MKKVKIKKKDFTQFEVAKVKNTKKVYGGERRQSAKSRAKVD